MPDNLSDSTYDLVMPWEESPPKSPVPAPQQPVAQLPPVLHYRPAGSAKVKDDQPYKMPASQRAFFWLRRVGALVIMLMGIAWLIFIPIRNIIIMSIGFGFIGAGFGMLIFSGPSESEKKGYHF